MTWQSVASMVIPHKGWKFTQPVDGQLFRMRSVNDSPIFLELRQAQTNDGTEFWDFRRFRVAAEFTLLRLDPPEFFTYRRLALRRADTSFATSEAQVIIEVSDMALSNPSTVSVNFPFSSVTTSTTVAAATTSTSLLAANANRKGATFWNNSAATLFLELGATASQAAYTAQLLSGGYYELPFGYTGAVSGIWSAVNGSVFVRELT